MSLVRSQQELAAESDLIIAFTPGSASVESAQAFASVLDERHVYVDFASATPTVKLIVADTLKGTGATVGDGSILGNPANGYAMPMLVSGAASEVVSGDYPDWTKGALYFHNTSVKPPWRKRLLLTNIIGHHIFYRDPA